MQPLYDFSAALIIRSLDDSVKTAAAAGRFDECLLLVYNGGVSLMEGVKRMGQEVITIVSGLPRSGTSMMMRMLQAGGIPLLTDNVRMADDDNP
jgi:hypothetical protein